ncbi:hypothetical protein [Shimazuella alba]|uniref:Uncharacterized protein n=1 Tax=Shimazuella alba TaxID=2690964 RepID=A0A6I4VRT8_9BACL|nr:hypothetical protein [Shimazuella alba]MXQ53158.1 hypothetical protein [Shimazuella alba]
MEPFVIGDIWYGEGGTAYENVSARIDAITTRNVQVSFDRTMEHRWLIVRRYSDDT